MSMWRWWGLMALAVVGCSEEPARNDAPPFNQGPIPVGTCERGLQCYCDSGLVGTTACQGNDSSCDCSACEATLPQIAPTVFEACGGDPTGAWELDHVDYSNLVNDTTPNNGLGGCRIFDVVDNDFPPYLLFELKSGGVARVFGASGNFAPRLAVSCYARIGGNCQAEGGKVDACGICTSPRGIVQREAEENDAWTQDGAVLNVQSFGKTQYCVNGNELVLRDVGGDILFKLRRVELAGASCLISDYGHVTGCTATPL